MTVCGQRARARFATHGLLGGGRGGVARELWHRVSRGIVTRGTARLLESLRTLGREKNLRPDAPGTGGTGSSADAEGASLPFLHSARQTGQLGERSSHLVRGRGGVEGRSVTLSYSTASS